MKFQEFENVMSASRMSRYLRATNSNTKRTMTLYRKNLQLSQELFTVIGCFELALRNAIDRHYLTVHGSDWLRQAAAPNGMFDDLRCELTAENINDAIAKLGSRYSHDKLVAELGFGFWRYMFAAHQFLLAGQSLLAIFPAKPQSTPRMQYNASFVFNQLSKINNIRNRIAHHEPICFKPGQPIRDTTYARQHYSLVLQLFQWLSIDEGKLLYGLDHVNSILNEIDIL